MAPPFIKYWQGWNRPISVSLLGSHKTVAGAVVGITMAVIVALILRFFDWQESLLASDRWLSFGIVAGSCAMGGDITKSFFKRRLGLVPGQRWIPFDQLDFVWAGLAGLSFFVPLDWMDVLEISILSFFADVAVNHLSFTLGIRDTKW